MRSSPLDRTTVKALQARRLSNRDNSFATARNLGTFSSFGGSIGANGIIGRSDRRDVLKFTILTGFSTTGGGGRLIVRDGTLSYSLYSSINGGRPQRQFTQRLSPATYPFTNPSFSITEPFVVVTQFIVFDRPTGNVRYSYREVF